MNDGTRRRGAGRDDEIRSDHTDYYDEQDDMEEELTATGIWAAWDIAEPIAAASRRDEEAVAHFKNRLKQAARNRTMGMRAADE